MNKYENIRLSARQQISSGKEPSEVLEFIAGEAQKLQQNGSVVSILLLDDQGLLRNGASPNLPQDYLAAIDGIRPDPAVGTCAAVAATGKTVFTPDFCADDKWKELKHLPLAIGFRGAWSMPIKNAEGQVIGTFGTYFKDVRMPSDEEMEAIRQLSEAVSEVLSAAQV